MIKVLNNGGVALHTNLRQLKVADLKHKIRHPVETLDLKIKKITNALKVLDEELNTKNKEGTQLDFDGSVEKKIFDYVQALDELYDSSFLIIKSLNETVKSDNTNAILWCKENSNSYFSEFKGSVDRYHNIIRTISNKIKHDSLKADFVTLVDNKKNKISGFYFSNIIGENNLNGADLDIHQEYQGSSTAYSYNYFIKFTVGFVFYLLDKLNSVLFKNKKLKNEDFVAWSEILSVISIGEKYQPLFFPDEFEKYDMSLIRNKKSFSITFPHKSSKKIGSFITSVKPTFRMSHIGGESCNKFPYHTLMWL
jgi:hypothetical protein